MISSAAIGSSSAASSYSIRGTFGNLGIFASANTRAHFQRLSDTEIISPHATAYAQASVYFTDHAHIESATLPKGAPVTLRFSGLLDAQLVSFRSNEPEDSYGQVFAQMTISGGGEYGSFYDVENYCIGDLTPGSDCNHHKAGSFVRLVNAHVGDDIVLQGSLSGYVQAVAAVNEAYYQTSFSSENIQSLHSSHYYLDSQDESATITFSSGHDYAAPVPEVATWKTSSCGVAVLWCVLCLRRARQLRPVVEARIG